MVWFVMSKLKNQFLYSPHKDKKIAEVFAKNLNSNYVKILSEKQLGELMRLTSKSSDKKITTTRINYILKKYK